MVCSVCIHSLGGLRFYKESSGKVFNTQQVQQEDSHKPQHSDSPPHQVCIHPKQVATLIMSLTWSSDTQNMIPMWNCGRPKMAITFATSPLESRNWTLLLDLARWATSLRCWCRRCRPQVSASDPHVLGLNVLSYLWLRQHFVEYVQGSEAWRSCTIHGTACWVRLQLFHVLYPVQLLTQNHETEWKYT